MNPIRNIMNGKLFTPTRKAFDRCYDTTATLLDQLTAEPPIPTIVARHPGKPPVWVWREAETQDSWQSRWAATLATLCVDLTYDTAYRLKAGEAQSLIQTFDSTGRQAIFHHTAVHNYLEHIVMTAWHFHRPLEYQYQAFRANQPEANRFLLLSPEFN